MDLMNDEPRQHPKPVPFCQNSLLQPAVPEVSLLLQENFGKNSGKKTDSFTGTEFQSYNAWRWKNMNTTNSNSPNSEPKNVNKHTSQDFYLIKDKYFTSDIEKRKNEILYGDSEEPRRPLPPRTTPVIPTPIESFFSNSSCDDLKPAHTIQEPQHKTVNSVHMDKRMASGYSNETCFKKELDNSEKLYSIISEQNKQMEVLQNQIEQLLKLQEVKDKQIEQLLNSQESKEKKIKNLLQSLDSKDKELGRLIESKGNQEQHLQNLLKSYENIQKENSNLIKKLNEITHKDVQTVGVMACVELADANTCTSLDDVKRECSSQKTDSTVQEDISVLRDNSRFDEKEKSLSLHSADLPVFQENAPTPQSSIHVDIPEFPESSDDSESESSIPTNRFSPLNEAQPSSLGYTFYNNVLSQLKGIIQNSGEKENSDKKLEKHKCGINKPTTEYNLELENEERVQSWGFIEENVPRINNGHKINEGISNEFQNICLKDTSSPSDVSLKINALAMKYLKQEQISELGLQTQIPGPCQHDVTIYNVTNLSFGSLRYLDRYQMLPNVKESQKQMTSMPKNEHSPAEFLRRKKRMTIEESITSVGNVLDITTLNQQPKLL